MATRRTHIIGKYYILEVFKFFYREFLFLAQKILLIYVITFVNIGANSNYSINKVIICILIIIASSYIQYRAEPFICITLNDLNNLANATELIVLASSLFYTVSDDKGLQIFCLIITGIMIVYFLIVVISEFVKIKIFLSKENKITKKMRKMLSRKCKVFFCLKLSSLFSFRKN